MPLTIITNEQAFAPNGESSALRDLETRHLGTRHLGTRDRFDPSIQFDYPGKAIGCLKAARMLQRRTLPEAASTLLGPLFDGEGQRLAPIGWKSSNRMPALKDLQCAHPAHYLEAFAACVARSQALAAAGKDPYVTDFGEEADVTPGTLDAARLAVGAAYDTIDVLLGSPGDHTGFGLVWPPGHHAERSLAMGFCYLSNIALAALYARDHSAQVRPGHRNRVVVIDIDHHRGNGTADVLAEQADTLFIDVSYRSSYDEVAQRFTDGSYNPATDRYKQAPKEYPHSRPDKVLELKAHPMPVAPNILSVEFEGEQTAPASMERLLEEVLPQVQAFNPDVILWSVGLDSATGDPIGGLGNLPSSFCTMIRGLRLAFPQARHGGLLEGGYDELRWYTCLPPALLALHDRPQDNLNRCKAFATYRSAFESRSRPT